MSRLKDRRAARARAFQALYGIGFAKVQTEGVLRAVFANTPLEDDTAVAQSHTHALKQAYAQDFAWDLVYGVWSHTETIDALIAQFSHHWRIDRMGRVEIALLRLAIYEIVYCEDIPAKVAMNEALELAKHFGEDNARAFINGILDAVAKAVERGEVKAKYVP